MARMEQWIRIRAWVTVYAGPILIVAFFVALIVYAFISGDGGGSNGPDPGFCEPANPTDPIYPC